ncbi:MAG: hypothetical protein Q8N27_06105 [Candidatus Hydromicrobium sp.]|nr:hypothetical protein [Candidatus Hydromicrobium sp.]
MNEKNPKKEIVSFINEELNNIKQLLSELSECKGNSYILRRARGSILHDFYNACERIFELITHRINGGVAVGQQWHKKLLYQMTMNIEDVRPPVISKKLAAELDEYLAFRHLFRNIYGFELESKRLDKLIEKFPDTVELLFKEINDFLKKL